MALPLSLDEDVTVLPCVAALDARIKLGVLCIMLAAIFSSREFWRLSILAIFILGLCVAARVSVMRILRRIHALRWMLIAAPLLHLIQGSGRTLMGISFLSFDGLVKGVLVSWQLALAIVCSSLFCWTTSIPASIGALRHLAGPLRRLGPCRRLAGHLMLVWMWIPLVQEEMLVIRRGGVSQHGGRGKVRGLVTQICNLFDRLLELFDALVFRVSAAREGGGNLAMPPAPGVGFREISVLSIALVLGLLWFWGLP